jgi:hypothetical protein
MTPADFKALEGEKIQPLLGAIAALGAGGLLSLGADGAPFFLLSVTSIVGAYCFWLGVDNHYFTQIETKGIRHGILLWKVLVRQATQSQIYMIFYIMVSIVSLILGFYGAYGTIKLSVSIDVGFAISGLLILAGLGHCALEIQLRRMVRERVIRIAARAAF